MLALSTPVFLLLIFGTGFGTIFLIGLSVAIENYLKNKVPVMPKYVEQKVLQNIKDTPEQWAEMCSDDAFVNKHIGFSFRQADNIGHSKCVVFDNCPTADDYEVTKKEGSGVKCKFPFWTQYKLKYKYVRILKKLAAKKKMDRAEKKLMDQIRGVKS